MSAAGGGAAGPLLLMPVRLETRFADSPAGSELWVRVYPDQIMVNGHHPQLSDAELAAGNSYWRALWLAGNPPPDPDAAVAPWRGLVSRYGAPRAAWIARQTTPLNVDQRPAAPTPPGTEPDPEPQPPSPAAGGSSWDAPATAALLPPAWTVVLDSGGTTASFTGSPITPDLALSLSAPGPGLAGGFADGLPVDEGMRWMVDFDAAVAAGMALRIPITPASRQAGFDRVLVYGVTGPDGDGAAALADLLDAHHYADGLTFVPQGSPTRNTADAPSAFSRADPGALISYAVEAGPGLAGDPAADGPLTAAFLGVPAATFDHVRFAGRYDMRDGQDMVTALWPATLGYFLRQLSDGSLTDDQVEQARAWTIANVRPRGPLPAIAAGPVAYGILPVTATALFVPGDDPVQAAVLRMVRRLLPAWTASTAAAPHLGATPGDPDADLAHVLGMDASSVTFRGRHLLGDELMWNLASFLGLPPAGVQPWWQRHLAAGQAQLAAAGYQAWDPRVIHASLSPDDFPVLSPTVVAGPLSETEPLPADASIGSGMVNYITWLRSASVADLRANNYPGPAVPDTLLYKILRQSVLLDYVTLAQGAQLASGELTIEQTRESELVGIAVPPAAADQPAAAASPAIEQVTPWDVLARPVSAQQPVTWAEYLVTLDPGPGSPFERLADLRASLDRLAVLPTAELDRLLTETLDTCSHRLDAWITALATDRLTTGRPAAGRQAGQVRPGAYGFVENLRPAAPAAAVGAAVAARVSDLDARRARLFPGAPAPRPPVQPAAGNGGFVHAPSLTQAATGAVLRSGYLSHQGGADAGLLAVDLSSDRVRQALYLLAGVQRGQPLGALLGYQLESAMHDAGLDAYIQPLRDAFPLVAGKLTAGTGDSGTSQVTDALALDRARQAGTLAPGGTWGPGLPAPGPDQDALLALFADLDDTVDAISDVGLAEAVYQAMRGNPERAGGTFDAIAQAGQMPDPQVVGTPRGGTDHTERLCVLMAGPPGRAAAWAAIPATPRSLAEPWLDAWLSGLLPDPAGVTATVSYTAGGPPVTASVRLADLGAGPLDVLAMSRIAAGGRSELDARIRYHVVPPGAADISVSYPAAEPPDIGFADLLNVARALADLVGGARPLAAADLALPAAAIPAGTDAAELNGRASAALTAVTGLVPDLAAAAAGTLAPDAARDALMAAAGFGVPGAVPPSRRGSGPDPQLAAVAAPVHDAMAARAAAMSAITLDPADAAPALAMLDAAFGSGLVILPRFAPPESSLAASFAADPALIGATHPAAARWRQQLTHVRDAVARLDLAELLADLVAGRTPPPLRIAQLPAVSDDWWLALPLPPGSRPAPGRVAIMAAVTGDVTAAGTSWAGLFIDGWTDRVPTAIQSAGVAFNASEPAARAPSALLLAACPDPQAGWDDAALAQVLRETLALAQVRTVDLGSVSQGGQVLPALYFPFNLEEDTISMRLWPAVMAQPATPAEGG